MSVAVPSADRVSSPTSISAETSCSRTPRADRWTSSPAVTRWRERRSKSPTRIDWTSSSGHRRRRRHPRQTRNTRTRNASAKDPRTARRIASSVWPVPPRATVAGPAEAMVSVRGPARAPARAKESVRTRAPGSGSGSPSASAPPGQPKGTGPAEAADRRSTRSSRRGTSRSAGPRLPRS